jgi:hypothetical protein
MGVAVLALWISLNADRSFPMRWIVAPEFQTVDPSQLGLKSFVITIILFGIGIRVISTGNWSYW